MECSRSTCWLSDIIVSTPRFSMIHTQPTQYAGIQSIMLQIKQCMIFCTALHWAHKLAVHNWPTDVEQLYTSQTWKTAPVPVQKGLSTVSPDKVTNMVELLQILATTEQRHVTNAPWKRIETRCNTTPPPHIVPNAGSMTQHASQEQISSVEAL